MAHIILYDIRLPGDPELIWSPNTSKTRYALNYKGIPYKVIWLTYPEVRSEIPKITKSDRAPTVPVIVDLLHGDKVIQDSWKIAKYLEEAYPNTPSLFNSNAGVHLFFHNYLTDNLLWVIVRLTVLSLMDKTDEDKDYFRRTREDFLGMTLEEYAGDEEGNGKQMTAYLEPIGKVFKVYPYISGTQVGYADITLASYFRMLIACRPDLFNAWVINDVKAGGSLKAWWKRMGNYM